MCISAETEGIIPADAGSTATSARLRYVITDHPRGRGEHGERQASSELAAGSSPRTRGAPSGCLTVATRSRIIPADAGSTRWGSSARGGIWDHPRGRGEHWEFKAPADASPGSSPRTRGAPGAGVAHQRRPRIIPADAGSTSVIVRSYRSCGDHPRGRGEHSAHRSRQRSAYGSSPRTRGAPGTKGAARRNPGIIPADAGSTSAQETKPMVHKDHPRGRGEHSSVCSANKRGSGSSPRTRGAQGRFGARHNHGRIIPADAGSTGAFPARQSLRSDHPRGRGEHHRADS